MRNALLVLLITGGVAAADPGHLTGSLHVGIGKTADVFDDDAPQGHPWHLELEVGWRAHRYLSVAGFADYSRFTDDITDPFQSQTTYHVHQRDLDLGVRVYGHLGPVFAGLGVGSMFHRDQVTGADPYTSQGRLMQIIAGVDVVHTAEFAFGLAAELSHAWFPYDEYIDQSVLWLAARWR